MFLPDVIKEKLLEVNNEQYNKLWSVSQEIVSDVINHNKRIMSQMSNYDLHDETHSVKVIEIIEKILGEKISALTCYELILIYLSAYVHDSAMALPEWEYSLLKAVEGTDDFYDNTLSFRIGNDFKKSHSFTEALQIVKSNANSLFNYEKTKGYVFSNENEDQFFESLAEMICSYEEFRNGYITELKSNKLTVAKYMDISRMIRSEYIRQTHHVRAVQNVCSLKSRIASAIDSYYADKFINDLSSVCKCHGESIVAVFELETEREDWLNEKSNIQYVAMLLRLGDVIHFSSDRAPLSLYTEKRIEDEESFKHWNAKFQDLRFSFYTLNGLTIIKYTAFCNGPEVYYFIQDYLKWVDNELDNYYALKQRWEQTKLEKLDAYSLCISNRVERSEINYDSSRFIPKDNMRFVLNQSKILELLMGVELYKDKYLCLREVYQNSLDATKCMIAYNNQRGITEKLFVEFGIGEENIGGIKHKYLYCLDHGTGMNEHIIDKYLLHIGNSYYKSKEFSRKNTGWGFNVIPTSQFGIGILSGYMIADKIGITTVYYEDKSSNSLILEGVNEHCYYIQAPKIDIERIGNHGTIVKLYLKKEYSALINSKHIEKLAMLIGRGNYDDFKKVCNDWSEVKNNIGYILGNHIGICYKDIPVYVREDTGDCRSVISGNMVLSPENFPEISKEDLETLWERYHFWDGTPNPYKDLIDDLDNIQNYSICVATENIELYSHITLPKKGIKRDNLYYYSMFDFAGKKEDAVLVDGIYVSPKSSRLDVFSEILGNDVSHYTMVNFVGAKRPVLSVDRSSYVELPEIKEELKLAKEKFIESLKEIVCSHIKKEKIGNEDKEIHLIFNAVIKKFPSISDMFFKALCDTALFDAPFPDQLYPQKKLSINGIIQEKELVIESVDFTRYREVTRRILVGKMLDATKISVQDGSVTVLGDGYRDFPILRDRIHEDDLSVSTLVIKADAWEGKFKEYDLVNTLWPIISPNLFVALYEKDEIVDVSSRCKTISYSGNALQGIASLDPVVINPIVGIGIRSRDVYQKKKECAIGDFDHVVHNYWLFELSNYGETVRNENKSHSLFAYIAPRELTATEESRLKDFESSDPIYVRGVREGWSILFLGAMQEYIICPGIVSREYIVQQIPESLKTRDPHIAYYNTDGSKTF